MQDIKNTMHSPGNENPERSARAQRLRGWSDANAHEMAAQEGVDLSEDHLAVIHALRRYYLENGPVGSGRELDDMLNKEFSQQGGRRYLHKLFPGGPVTQGLRIADLPVPANSEDAGFGTAR